MNKSPQMPKEKISLDGTIEFCVDTLRASKDYPDLQKRVKALDAALLIFLVYDIVKKDKERGE